jgi:hypothetical protein
MYFSRLLINTPPVYAGQPIGGIPAPWQGSNKKATVLNMAGIALDVVAESAMSK